MKKLIGVLAVSMGVLNAWEMRFVNFTGDDFKNIVITDNDGKTLFEGPMEAQSYVQIKGVTRKHVPLTVSVFGEVPGRSVDLSVEDEAPLKIRVEKGDMWALYRDGEVGPLEITEINKAKKQAAPQKEKKAKK